MVSVPEGSFFHYQRELKAKDKEIEELKKELVAARAERDEIEKLRRELDQRHRETAALEVYIAEQYAKLEEERERLGIPAPAKSGPPPSGILGRLKRSR